ncbi:hypothetical protein LCGC14_1531230 [marine sediment metagenome]|uniref:Glycosyltransferase RgtA/B/C/D-like domain-containing protein n=1 Tax=marine sediment metagenome TaxID=412755 RepID=A0A0F9LWN9_9ZZZZ
MSMNLKEDYISLSTRFKDILKNKTLFYAVFLNIFYFIFGLTLTLTLLKDNNDFVVYYRAGQLFLYDLNGLYDPINFTSIGIWPFRYLPISAIYFMLFYLLGFNLGFILFSIINLILNILICVLLYKIIILIKGKDFESEKKRVLLYISIFLMSLPNLFNYILGQINLYVTFLILLSLFLFLKYESLKWDFISSFILGLSVIFKPITILMIPFLLVLKYNYKIRKFEFNLPKTLIRLVGALIPLFFNLLFFFLFPVLWKGFLESNFTGTEPIQSNHSFSISKLIINYYIFNNLPPSALLIIIILLLFFSCLGIIVYVFRRFEQNSIVIGYTFAILIMLLVYFDTWDHHLLMLTPLLIILVFLLPRNSEITKKFLKPSFIFLSFFDLIFMGIWFITQEFFPFNFMSTIFLSLTFFGIGKVCLEKHSND